MGQQGSGVSSSTLLALAILLLWLAGICLFIAFEGQSILGETVPKSGSGGASWFRAVIEGLTKHADTLAAAE